jgi:hypothetical protein
MRYLERIRGPHTERKRWVDRRPTQLRRPSFVLTVGWIGVGSGSPQLALQILRKPDYRRSKIAGGFLRNVVSNARK